MIGDLHMFDPRLALISLSTVLAMGGVAWRDILTFEIDFLLLAVAALAVSAVIVSTQPDSGLTGAIALAAVMAALTLLVHVIRPGQLGRGDIWLMGFIGLAAGPEHIITVLAALTLLSLLTAACYSHIRGKRLFRSMFPLALPGMGAGLLALVLRMRDAATGQGAGDFVSLESRVQILLVLMVLAGAACIGWAVIRHNRLRRNRLRRTGDVLYRIEGGRR